MTPPTSNHHVGTSPGARYMPCSCAPANLAPSRRAERNVAASMAAPEKSQSRRSASSKLQVLTFASVKRPAAQACPAEVCDHERVTEVGAVEDGVSKGGGVIRVGDVQPSKVALARLVASTDLGRRPDLLFGAQRSSQTKRREIGASARPLGCAQGLCWQRDVPH